MKPADVCDAEYLAARGNPKLRRLRRGLLAVYVELVAWVVVLVLAVAVLLSTVRA